ncbi:MAG TPA: sigma-70 family RNA polymerase sigma factor [Candidatus Acidoferrales bacterium]|nr:sigma-70 family RNA polymerase sigma factor [Candidatus Acidoferrales bacterium]
MTRMTESTQGSDAAAVERTLAGDQDAYRVLVERHSRSLFRLAYRMTGNEQDAEEIVQDTFLRAYRKLGQFESRANFGTWVYRIAVNCSLDRRRKLSTEEKHREVPPRTDDPDTPSPIERRASENPSPDRLALSVEMGKQITAALDELSAAERAAFVMRHWEGRAIEEIAQALHLRSSATKNTVFRAVQKLRRALEPFVMKGTSPSPPGRAMPAAQGTKS